jgi:hypothetical protein
MIDQGLAYEGRRGVARLADAQADRSQRGVGAQVTREFPQSFEGIGAESIEQRVHGVGGDQNPAF